MLNENAKKWVAALRSGKYQQTKACLTYNGCDCCLGVACKVAQDNGVTLFTEEKHFDLTSEVHRCEIDIDDLFGDDVDEVTEFDATAYDGQMLELPASVREWLGLYSASGAYLPNASTAARTSLALQNDKGKTFAEIADIIESCPPGLFIEYGREDRR